MAGRSAGLALLVAAVLLGACASPAPPPRWNLFAELPRDDVFTPGVVIWQGSRLLDADHERSFSPDASPLAAEYLRFAADLRREIVERTVAWVQTYSGLYFEEDGAIDHWPTLVEVMERGGDDCDGMDVLTFELLRAAGFKRGEIYRAVLRHAETELHHMVTLWFPEGERHDPYVLDPTGDVTALVRTLSEVDGWYPLVLFDETERFRAAAN